MRSIKDESDEESEEPSLTLSDTSFSSMDELLLPVCWIDLEEVTAYRQQAERRHVTFHPRVEVREYSLTISEHPYCDDPYPVSLDWAHAIPYTRHIDDSKSRGMTYNPGPRICVEAKRRRLAEVRGCKEKDIDGMMTRSPYEVFALDGFILSYMSKLLLTVTTPALDCDELEEDDEYLFLYKGITKGIRKIVTHSGTYTKY